MLPIELCKSKKMSELLNKQEEIVNVEPFIIQGHVYKQTMFYTNQLRYLVCDPFTGKLSRYELEKDYPKKPI
jgi:hypothetical protein